MSSFAATVYGSSINHELPTGSPAYHGAIDFAELARWNINPDMVIDFSTNVNPYGPTPAVREALADVPLQRFPDRDSMALRQALSQHHNVPQANIIVGNGSAELLWLAAFAFLRAGDRALVIEPTFGEYARNAQLMGADVICWRARPRDDFALHPQAIEALIDRRQPRLVYLCNPNNPTGQLFAPESIARWAAQFPQTLFLVDEAYLAFVQGMTSALNLALPNLLLIRSMTKDYALAGLRLGYAVGAVELIEGLTRVRIPWSVNGLAQAAGIAALATQADYEKMWEQLRQETVLFRQALAGLGYAPCASHTHYFLLNVGDGAAWREQLLQHGLLVRRCQSYQLPAFVRLATRTPAENARLLVVLQQLVWF